MAFSTDKTRQGAAGVSTGYEIPYSCRFNGTSTILERTPSSTGNRRMLTFSAWIKQGDVHTINGNQIFSAGVNGDGFHYQSGDIWRHTGYISSAFWGTRDWNGKQYDPSAWKHIVVRFDTEQDAELDRSRLFVNGVEVTVNHTYHTIAEDYDMRYNHTADAHWIGGLNAGSYFDGYMAEVHWIDGAIVSPNAFGEVGDYGEWRPKEYVVADYAAYGTNGYYLDFADSSHFGNDVSGNNNDFTDTGFGTHDQMLDTPTNNFCTWSPLLRHLGVTQNPIEGNLKQVNGSTSLGTSHPIGGTMAVEGKWYFEIMLGQTTYSHWTKIGIVSDIKKEYSQTFGDTDSSGADPSSGLFGWGYHCNNANKVHGGESSAAMSGGTSFGSGATSLDVMAIAVDTDAGKVWFAENNVWLDSGDPAAGSNPAWDDVRGAILPFVSTQDGSTAFVTLNCGQDSSFAGEKTAQGNTDSNGIGDFYYEPPDGFLAMCTSNLPDPAVVPNEHFNIVSYTGNSSTQSITGVGFQPDLIWVKKTSASERHSLTDAVRGVNSQLQSSMVDPETTSTDKITAFDADGFSLGADADTHVNLNTATFVAWNWKANGAGSSNEEGSINTTATSANVDAGFSISTYTGTGSNATVGHGLSKAPEFIVVKNRDQTDGWLVFHNNVNDVTDPETDRLLLNTTNIIDDDVTYWNDTAPTADVFSIGTSDGCNVLNEDYVAYCWHSVAGFSKFGMYMGNDNNNGPMINVGFRPKLVIIKITRSGGNDSWMMYDTEREPYNHADTAIFADDNTGPSTSAAKQIDILSNGFKVRGADGAVNDPEGSGGFYIYMAWAETPFKYANAR